MHEAVLTTRPFQIAANLLWNVLPHTSSAKEDALNHRYFNIEQRLLNF